MKVKLGNCERIVCKCAQWKEFIVSERRELLHNGNIADIRTMRAEDAESNLLKKWKLNISFQTINAKRK